MPIYIKYASEDLNSAYQNIDADFLKLSNASTESAFLKVEADPQVKLDLDTIGGSYLKLSDEFQLVDADLKFESFFIKYAPTPWWLAAAAA